MKNDSIIFIGVGTHKDVCEAAYCLVDRRRKA